MAHGKLISLEEVRKNPKLLKRFIKQHATEGDAAAFEATLESMVRSSPQDARTSQADASANSSETRTRRDNDEDT